MKCPVCDVDLQMADRVGVEIDYCSKCRGIWLDRGELDKIIERSSGSAGSRVRESAPRDDRTRDREDDREHDGENNRGGRRREGFLGGLFDMGD